MHLCLQQPDSLIWIAHKSETGNGNRNDVTLDDRPTTEDGDAHPGSRLYRRCCHQRTFAQLRRVYHSILISSVFFLFYSHKNTNVGSNIITLFVIQSANLFTQPYTVGQRSFLPRDAMLALCKLSSCVSLSVCRCVCVCVCVCLSVTLLYRIKTAKHRITQTKPHEAPGLLFFVVKDHGKIRTGSLPSWAPNADGGCRLPLTLCANNRCLSVCVAFCYRPKLVAW